MTVPTVSIHGKNYVMVKDRVVLFYNTNPRGCIKTKIVDYKEGHWIVKATCYPDPQELPETFFTGHAHEVQGSTQINKTSALENCETSAVGRCLAMAGYGAEESFASADEVANAVNQQKHDSK